ncbi:beta-ketoacyl-ACP synthase II [Candidatus Purcelliella pentastirinorum]|uniref:beta-ketoacyl-ACP synthase II n=1 Tax=Candidatus Purcelliella pentastirinorum TaxID=472834 RepID=UPI002367F2B7|nr:beta-ketoacyl-ACP synthase II [Candidatus Purcelliella pentastirinorum]WDI79072.1 beta-ketoacyl-ACP synthase II [Candidatus Purcelliella pentastirinorum]WDR80210.1 beta-ketoacyl-ACP synthase II [Candidatus Purcelliella pentastirinorum]
MSKRRVVITGMGILTPVGNNVKTNWKSIISGKSGIDYINHFNITKHKTHFAGLIKNFIFDKTINIKNIKKIDKFIQYGIMAGHQAIKDSGIQINNHNVNRIGVAVGSGIGGLGSIEYNHKILIEKGPKKISPFFVPSTIVNMISGYLTIIYGIKGPTIAITTACTSGIHNIGQSFRIITHNDADIMLAGASEKASTPLGIGGFNAARALSTRNHDPKGASRPWDKERDGFVLGDGAGILMLEELQHAKKRNAKIYAEIVGFGMSSDAYHITSPPKYGDGAAQSMINALKDAKINTDKIGYINAHATSTINGDRAEAIAIKNIFKKNKIYISSTKSMTGHLLGASGAIESIYSILALKKQIIPPTINLNKTDENYGLDFVPNYARQIKNLKYSLCNSFGFGGTNASIIFKKYD